MARDRRSPSEACRLTTKGQMRLERIFEQIPAAREQLLVAIEDLGPGFGVAAIQAAMQSGDPRERNKVAVIERELDVLIAYLEELASRGLSEGRRIGAVPAGTGRAFDQLADLGVISKAAAQRLTDVKDLRNQLACLSTRQLAVAPPSRGSVAGGAGQLCHEDGRLAPLDLGDLSGPPAQACLSSTLRAGCARSGGRSRRGRPRGRRRRGGGC